MASQLNPAWQRKTDTSSRLAGISARFLSDAPDTGNDKGRCRLIAFLLDSPQQNWVTHDLCQVLTRRGHSSLVCHLDESLGREQSAFTRELDKQASGSEYCLLPVTSPGTLERYALEHVVILVSAKLDAIRTTYQRIKLLSKQNCPEIGIVVVGPRDQHAAWRYFRKLAVGSLRYLDVPLLNLGFLPEQVAPEHGPSDHHRINFLSRISERLISTEFFTPCETQNSAKEYS
jgi:hypothetical protein